MEIAFLLLRATKTQEEKTQACALLSTRHTTWHGLARQDLHQRQSVRVRGNLF